MSVENRFSHKFSLQEINVYVDKYVMEAFREAVQSEDDNERFGVLIGSKSAETETYWIEALTEPYDRDDSTFTSFVMKDPAHQFAVDQKFDESHGELGYLGTWHTHPEPCPVPSRIDREDWLKCISNNRDRELFFFIVGRSETCLFKLKKRNFIKMSMTYLKEACEHV